MTSRVRCSCGRIYDPVKHTHCPDCGAESAVESVVVAEKVKPPAPPEPEQDRQSSPRPTPAGRPPWLETLPWPVFAGAAVLIFGILFFALRHRAPPAGGMASSGQGQGAPAAQTSPQPSAQFTPSQPTPSEFPSGGATMPPGFPAMPGSGNLNEMLASAAGGGTVKLRPGFYQGGAIVNKAVRIVGDAPGGQVVVQSDGKECLTVRSKNVFVQNVYFICNGIGDLPAVSVADGAELEMDGCKIQSGSALGVSVTNNSSLKALGTSFAVANGTALRLNQGHLSLTQCTFSDTKSGLTAANAGVADLHSCAFDRIGMSDSNGSIITVAGDKTQVTGEDCHFTGNSGSVSASDKASIALSKSTFKDNARSSRGGTSAGLIVLRNGAHGEIRNATVQDASPYAVNVMSGATLVMEDVEISGSRTAGLVVGEENGTPAHADVKHSQFEKNSTGIGVFAGSSADITDSECRQNNEGIVVLDRGSRVQVTKTGLLSNRDHGLYVYGDGEATIVDSDIQGNVRGAQSGTPRKGSPGSLTLQDCRVTANQVFGVGAYAKSQLTLNHVTFETNGKTNVYKEAGAMIQIDGVPDAGAAAQASPDNSDRSANAGQTPGKRNRKQRRPQSEEDARQIIRRFFRP